jgi:hypothetical protein
MKSMGSEDRGTPPPEPSRDACLMIVAQSGFSSGPLGHAESFEEPSLFANTKSRQTLLERSFYNVQKHMESAIGSNLRFEDHLPFNFSKRGYS